MTAPLRIAETVSRPDDSVRGGELDAWQLRRPGCQGVEAELQSGRDGAADVGAVGGHHVERRGGPEVDDDGGRAVEAPDGEGIDQAVGARLGRSVDADRDGDGLGGRLETRQAVACCHLAEAADQAGTTLATTIAWTIASSGRPSRPMRRPSSVSKASAVMSRGDVSSAARR